ncbi:aldehyde dehydrogenase family protein [Cupriavidus necator]
MIIDGRQVTSMSGKTMDIFNPATGEAIAQVPAGQANDIDCAVQAAHRALHAGPWTDMAPAEREWLLLKLADLVEAHGDELAAMETANQGKLLSYARAIEVNGSVQWLRYMAGWATKIEGSTLDVSMPGSPGTRYRASTRRVPVGVVGAIVPWNFPLLMAVWKIAPALAAGCTVVLKPAEETPLTALRLGELALRAGIPPGVLNVVTGEGAEAGAALVAHPLVSKISFTGSTEVGREIGAQCGRQLKHSALELGGKSPVIVLEDCDVERAIAGAASAIFFNHGQVCTAGSRLYVARALFERVVTGVATVAKDIRLGAGNDPQAQMGPMVSLRHQKRVQSLIATGVAEGATLLAGGDDIDRPGYYIQPTVFANAGIKPLTLTREEVFGPVLVAMPFDSEEEALAMANDSVYGLGASVWTNRLDAAYRFADRLHAGTVWVNAHNLVDPNLPFGGVKASGIGREHGRAAIEAYTEIRAFCVAY